ncbi:hypothetical protein GGX14DRAFT_393609 [Mycena pura]|uniref:Uncharacterized protein n=1 Tax=Mycena pura TaxID=153505 RepID=A0AAD6VPH3_9AGAR|nr:hypothetical protein GGX14DRAFT_393609 [Mycena pura]
MYAVYGQNELLGVDHGCSSMDFARVAGWNFSLRLLQQELNTARSALHTAPSPEWKSLTCHAEEAIPYKMPAPRSGFPSKYFPPRATFASLVFPNTDSTQPAPDAKSDLGKFAVFVAYFFIRRVLRQRRGAPDASADTDGGDQPWGTPSAMDYLVGCAYTYGGIPTLHLPYPVPAYSSRATAPCGRDVDAAGSQLGASNDVLPAYDAHGGPPGYSHVLVLGVPIPPSAATRAARETLTEPTRHSGGHGATAAVVQSPDSGA